MVHLLSLSLVAVTALLVAAVSVPVCTLAIRMGNWVEVNWVEKAFRQPNVIVSRLVLFLMRGTMWVTFTIIIEGLFFAFIFGTVSCGVFITLV